MPVPKYELDADDRIQSEYTPATAPLSLTDIVKLVGEEYVEDTLVTTLVGVPVHDVDEITKADPSPATLTKPAPVIATVDRDALAGITVGDSEVTLRMLSGPASMYVRYAANLTQTW